jgi:microcin C transport system substrate-binding protein
MLRAMIGRRASLAVLVLALVPGPAGAGVSHGLSVFGDLKYAADFKHFEYVNPNAPKGGEIRTYGIDSFDTLNPFLLRGVPPTAVALLFDTLMVRALDEPDAMYGLVAGSVEMPDDKSWIAFRLRPEARFHDGTKVTAEDVVATFELLLDKGHPRFKLLYEGVAGVTAPDAATVRFDFKPGPQRDLPVRLAELPVLSRAYYEKVPFDRTTVEPPLTSGPYRVGRIEPGRRIEYVRVPDWWAKDLAVSRGTYNFDRVRIEYFRDRDVALEGFFAGAYDYREEFTARDWSTKYADKPAVQSGLIVRETLPDNTPSGVQAWFFNLRRERFADRRVREALDLAFDFAWTNQNLFYGLYERTSSMFENSNLAAREPPGPDELALLEPLRGKVPEEVFTTPFKSPVAGDAAKFRAQLRRAAELLRAAGWTVRDGKLRNAKGEAFEIEFLIFESGFQRIINPYIRNLERLGIDAKIRVVDVANFINRRLSYDFDVVIERYVQNLTPGIEQREYWGSQAAAMQGSRNLAGIRDAAVDALIEKVIAAKDRPSLVSATRALDRVLMWNRYSVPQWYKGVHNIAYWNKFSRPAVAARYDLPVLETWWYDEAKARALAQRQPAAPQAPPARPEPLRRGEGPQR